MNAAAAKEIVLYQAGRRADRTVSDADPITTEIVRHSLNSAANQMKRALIRTAFSVVIYEMLDFAVAIYDRKIRLLAQSPTLPAFMGTMSFCVEAAVEAIGGEDALEPGDVIIYNLPYGTGSHAQDAAIVMPVFRNEELIGYTTNKAHWMDIGAKNPYCTDTTDVYQEGVKFPGVKLYSRGKLVDDIYRMVLANCRMPDAVAGDIQAQVASARVGANELVRVVDRFGSKTFDQCVERMYDHGEAIVRSFFERIPDGRYVGRGCMDNNGVDEEPIDFEIVVEVEGSTVRIDYSGVPDSQAGPINCPFPSTVSGSRVAMTMLAGGSEAPNEGHFRPLELITRPGSMFHPQSPAPCYLYGWSLVQAMEAIYSALASALSGVVPSGSAGDLCGVLGFGQDPMSHDYFFVGTSLPVGQGAHAGGDGGTMYITALAQQRLQSAELQEAKAPVLFEKWELRSDTGGPGKYRGGLGWDYEWRALAPMGLISTIERTRVPAWAQQGGLPGSANKLLVVFPDGRTEEIGKVTDLPAPADTIVKIHCGGGGGYGPPGERDPKAVLADLEQGYVTEPHAREHYPQAFR